MYTMYNIYIYHIHIYGTRAFDTCELDEIERSIPNAPPDNEVRKRIKQKTSNDETWLDPKKLKLEGPAHVKEVAQHLCTQPPQTTSPLDQAQMTASGTSKSSGYDLFNEPVLDESRSMPTNFLNTNLDVYLRLPKEALPQGPCTGKCNYTIRPVLQDGSADLASKARIEVHLADKRFFAKQDVAGNKVEAPAGVTFASAGNKYIYIHKIYNI